MSNLRFLNKTTGTSVSTVSVTDVFSADYDIYKISICDVDLNTGGGNSTLQLRYINSFGDVVVDSDYDYAYHNVKSFSSFTESNDQNASYIQGLSWLGDQSDYASGMYCLVFNPFNNDLTTMNIFASSTAIVTGDKAYYTRGIGMLEHIHSMTGFELSCSTGSFDSVTINTFGYRVD
tara:strand:+ start:614 stop:1144 length:531 start_codon:yes stop_codon:yes gene_type:complete